MIAPVSPIATQETAQGIARRIADVWCDPSRESAANAALTKDIADALSSAERRIEVLERENTDLRNHVPGIWQTVVHTFRAKAREEVAAAEALVTTLKAEVEERRLAYKAIYDKQDFTESRLASLAGQAEDMRAALEKIAGSHWERVGYDQTDIADVPDLSAEEAMNAARAAIPRPPVEPKKDQT